MASSFQKETVKLSQENSLLQSQISDLENRNISLEDNLFDLSQGNSRMQDRIDVLMDRNLALENENDALETDLELAKIVAKFNTISGYAFIDNVWPGKFDDSDPPAIGLQVDLWRVDKDGNGEILLSTITDSNGCYRFSGVPTGKYYVSPKLKLDGYPGWVRSTNLRWRYIEVTQGQDVLGPVILVNNNDNGMG